MLYKIYKTLVTGLVWMVLLQVWYGWFCYRSGMDDSVTGLVWMVLELEQVAPPSQERIRATPVFPSQARYMKYQTRK